MACLPLREKCITVPVVGEIIGIMTRLNDQKCWMKMFDLDQTFSSNICYHLATSSNMMLDENV